VREKWRKWGRRKWGIALPVNFALMPHVELERNFPMFTLHVSAMLFKSKTKRVSVPPRAESKTPRFEMAFGITTSAIASSFGISSPLSSIALKK
jgi:hypothetical protein